MATIIAVYSEPKSDWVAVVTARFKARPEERRAAGALDPEALRTLIARARAAALAEAEARFMSEVGRDAAS